MYDVYDPSTWEAKAGRLLVQDQTWLQINTFSQQTKETKISRA